MRHLRLLVITVATICVLALGAFALVRPSAVQVIPADDIIIKGGSLEVDCGKKHGRDCFGNFRGGRKPKHKNSNKHILQIVVRDSAGGELANHTFDKDHPPSITITYK